MVRFSQNDRLVKRTLGQERLQAAGEDFDVYESDDDWTEDLAVNKRGDVLSTVPNIILILNHDPNLKGKMAWNSFSHRPVIKGDLPWRKIQKVSTGRTVTIPVYAIISHLFTELKGKGLSMMP
jgi:putative DNA primase/helicase